MVVNFMVVEGVEDLSKWTLAAQSCQARARLKKADRASRQIGMDNVLPGFIDSLPEKQEFCDRIPMQRYGKTAEISEVIAFLAPDGAGYITGQNLRVDSGITRSVWRGVSTPRRETPPCFRVMRS